MYSDVLIFVRAQVMHCELQRPSVLREYCGAAGGVVLSSPCTYSYFHPYRVHGSRRKTGANSCWSFVAVVPVKHISLHYITHTHIYIYIFMLYIHILYIYIYIYIHMICMRWKGYFPCGPTVKIGAPGPSASEVGP